MTAPALPLPLARTAHPVEQADVARVVAEAAGSRMPVYPIGGGVGLCYGVAPEQAGVGLSLTKLKQIVDYPARDLTITVETGLTIAELAAQLARQRQRLPVDVPMAGRATVGGAIAAGASGPRRCAYGTLRDYLLGFRAVDGRGTPFCGGGRVVKNAAGYDMCKLMVGSLGTLAVTTQVTLMVRPMPEASALMACAIDDFDAAERLLADVAGAGLLPAAVELLAGPEWREDSSLPPGPAGAARLVVGFEGPQAEVDWMTSRLADRWQKLGAKSITPLSPCGRGVGGEGAPDNLWRRLADFPFAGDTADSLAVSITARPSAVARLARTLLEIDDRLSLSAHAASGVVRAAIPLSSAEEAGPLVRMKLRPAAVAAEANLVVLFAPEGARLSAAEVWGPPPEGLPVMRSLKQHFDPAGILNPGRFIFPAGQA